ncbi:MAG: ribonuclease H-like domain-containing protein, partial [Eudoraea sp.]|nr:ribonuclease H-like domain-containing protein [Eudoraea sp.]
MLKKLNLEHLVFLDIETVPEFENFENLPEDAQALWAQKTEYRRKEDESPEDFYVNAGIWAEFGRIICISVGYFHFKGNRRGFRVTSFHGTEPELLNAFRNLLNTHFYAAKYLLCAHNGKEFDFPYIARRMIIHNIPLPQKLDLFGKKPWEVPHLDTMELWKFGDFKHYT